MQDKLVIAIDQGTTSTRAVVFNENGLPVAAYQYELTQIHPHPGWVEHDPLALVEACKACLEEVQVQLEDKHISLDSVVAAGIANQRETSVLWDRRTGEPAANAIVWSDTRTESLVQELEARPGANRVRELCGLPLNSYFAATKVRWLLDNNTKVRQIYEEGELCFGTVDSWLIYALSGGRAHVTDASNASRSMLMNLRKMEYDDELIEFFDFGKLILPEIRPSSEVYTKLYFPESKLDGLPIAGCIGDQAAALVGQFGFEKGDAKNTYGTGCFLFYNTGDEPVISEHGLITTVAYHLPNQKPAYALEGSIAMCGAVIKWLQKNLGIIEISEQVGDLITCTPDSAGVYFVTAFSGLLSPYWRADARGTIVGLTLYSTRAHIVRAAIEAVCFQTRAIYETMERDTGTQNGRGCLKVDGGLTSSDQIMQLQADIAGVEVVRPAMKEVTAFGAAILAGLAVGVWKDTKDCEMRTSLSAGQISRFKPNIGSGPRDEMFRQWNRAVERAVGWAEPEEDQKDQALAM